MKNGIDVSHWQGAIDWKKVKDFGIEFAIIKAGGSDAGFYTDSAFEANYTSAKMVGVPVGAYYFVGSGFTSVDDGVADAKRFIDIIKGKAFEYPVVLDIESTSPSDKAGATDATIAFCETMENAGYYVSIYASDISGFKEKLDISRLGDYDKWVARYGSHPQYVKEYGMWQKASNGLVEGIGGRVDLDESYKDYPTLIASMGLNGLKKVEDTPAPTPEKTVTELANEVIRGEWGNGNDRNSRLTAAGHDYSAVQTEVNRILGVTAESPKNEPKTGFCVGDTAHLTDDATYYDGTSIPIWVKSKLMYIRQINGDRVVISTLASGAVTGAVNIKHLKE